MITQRFKCTKCDGIGLHASARDCIYCDGEGFIYREVEETEDRIKRGERLGASMRGRDRQNSFLTVARRAARALLASR